jgi:hypothetical protein
MKAHPPDTWGSQHPQRTVIGGSIPPLPTKNDQAERLVMDPVPERVQGNQTGRSRWEIKRQVTSLAE